MFLKLLLCLIFVSSAVAAELRVIGRHRTYRINWDAQQIDYEAPSAKLKFEKKECNAHMFEKFSKNMLMLDRAPEIKGGKSNLEYILNGKSYKIREKSRTGLGLLKLPEEIRRMKIEESLVCKKS